MNLIPNKSIALCEESEHRAEKAEAEVNRLNHQLLKTESDLLQSQDINSWIDSEYRIACKRAEKADTEVEAYKKLAKELCEELSELKQGNK